MKYHSHLTFGVVTIEKGAFESPSTKVANFTTIYCETAGAYSNKKITTFL